MCIIYPYTNYIYIYIYTYILFFQPLRGIHYVLCVEEADLGRRPYYYYYLFCYYHYYDCHYDYC